MMILGLYIHFIRAHQQLKGWLKMSSDKNNYLTSGKTMSCNSSLYIIQYKKIFVLYELRTIILFHGVVKYSGKFSWGSEKRNPC